MLNKSLIHRIEALIFASDEPLSIKKISNILGDEINTGDIRAAITELETHYAGRGIGVYQVAGGWQFRSDEVFADSIAQLWHTRPPKLSRALLETLAIIAYRQPTTRSEIESLRGTKVSSNIIATLMDRGWIKILGRKDVPGRPHLLGTGKQFLIDFGLNSLGDLPEYAQLMDEDSIQSIFNRQHAEESDSNNPAPNQPFRLHSNISSNQVKTKPEDLS